MRPRFRLWRGTGFRDGETGSRGEAEVPCCLRVCGAWGERNGFE
jgi:hypothetical protein